MASYSIFTTIDAGGKFPAQLDYLSMGHEIKDYLIRSFEESSNITLADLSGLKCGEVRVKLISAACNIFSYTSDISEEEVLLLYMKLLQLTCRYPNAIFNITYN